MNDPRHRNELLDSSSIGAYLVSYAKALEVALISVDASMLDRAREVIDTAARDGKRIYAVGNGGSAAIADHLGCDFTKGTHAPGHPVIDTRSLSSNVALYSAIANDYGFEKVFSTQVALVGKPGDVLIAISSSGNSENILNAVRVAGEAGLHTIGLSGFSGGSLKTLVQVPLHVNVNNYGLVEDAHQSLIHILAQFIACQRDRQRA